MLPLSDDDRATFAVLRGRLSDVDARRLSRRLEKLTRDFIDAETEDGEAYGLAVALFRRTPDA
jgi:hypothetical protein